MILSSGKPTIAGGSLPIAINSRLANYVRAKRYAIENGLGEWVERKNGVVEWRMEQTPAQIERIKADREIARANATRRRIAESGIPDLYRDANFVTNAQGKPLQIDDGNAEAIKRCRQYAAFYRPKVRGCLLVGPNPGCGKTYPMCAALSVTASNGYTVRFIRVARFLELIRESFGVKPGAGSRTAGDIMREYSECDVLLLDDLGSEKIAADSAGDWSRDRVFELIDTRLNASRTTLGTSNLTEDMLKSHYGTRTWSRMCDKAHGWELVPVKGPDRRNPEDPFSAVSEED